MSDPTELVQENRQRDVAAAALKRMIPEIMRRWERLVREKVPAAGMQDTPVLFDDIPEILVEIAQALAIGNEGLFVDSEASRAHAVQRVEIHAYTLDQMVHEYQLLRCVVVEALGERVPLDLESLNIIHGTLDQSIQESVDEYVRLQQQDLRESEERYRLLVEGVKDYAIFMLDPHGRVTSWNDGARRIFGYEAEDVLGDHFSCIFGPEDAAEGGPDRLLREAEARGAFEAEGWRVRKDGTRFWANGSVTALRSPDAGLRGFSMINRDITERKFLEDQLHHQADELARADRRKNDFLAMVAHELRTPLSAITNSLYILSNIELNERALNNLSLVNRQTRQLARLVEDLMDISRINSGKIDLQWAVVPVDRVAADAVQTVLPFIESRGQELEVEIASGPLPVRGDATRLEQIITNLLNNAAKYTEPGGQIWLTVAREDSAVVARVRDTGMGIDAAMLPSIFDLFSQVDPSEARSHGGLGIGLSLVKRLADLHGGTVTASSEGLGRGAEFAVRLPLAISEDA